MIFKRCIRCNHQYIDNYISKDNIKNNKFQFFLHLFVFYPTKIQFQESIATGSLHILLSSAFSIV